MVRNACSVTWTLDSSKPPFTYIRGSLSLYGGRGTHHVGKVIWEPVVEKIAATVEHPLFDLAWEHIASTGNGARVAAIVNSPSAHSTQTRCSN